MEIWIEIDLERQVEVLPALYQLGFTKKCGGDAVSAIGATKRGIFFGHLDPSRHDEARLIEGVSKLGHEGLSRTAFSSSPDAPEPAQAQHRSPPNPHRRRRQRR